MSEDSRLTKDQLRKLKDMCKQGNYEAIVALLKVHIDEAIDTLKVTGDPRFLQGKVQALEHFLEDIVRKQQ
jgi:DNA-binding GntR family transcriptional regulator